MAFIEVIAPQRARGRLRELYAKVTGPGGQVDQVLQIHSLRPHTLQGHMSLYKAVLHHTGNRLPIWFLECIGVLVSRLNACEYCEQHHAAGLRRLLRAESKDDDAYLAALATATPGRPFTPRQRQALAYARKLTLEPGGIGQADIEGLRQAGFDDGEILEINQVAAYFAYANRTVTGLGVSSEGEVLGLSPDAIEGEEHWHHD
ncbi:MAG: peroxidase-related enzyme [Xanthomonadales bacterium]|nr:peroxidase-related enzyme [Xanthomonadales bacterium]NIN60753.1 peroxidase-related enzyme [Xanthomonadales bacterium]NIN76115.1 peroxidase-related enzyme [Xanthomonadales bacterium]NIO15336.1 peroxidase-related enzyme [Xanthomonadales bacterium]NIP13146.1 peroxidase-related enzyme [Xanthomonadales bacterium]